MAKVSAWGGGGGEGVGGGGFRRGEEDVASLSIEISRSFVMLALE